MKKFLAIYHTPVSAMEQMGNATDEQKAETMSAWMKWHDAHKENIVDFGAPTMPTGTSPHQSSVGIGGYSILQAESLEALQEACKDHPHVGWDNDATIEFLECIPM